MIDTRILLAALWVCLMLIYLLGDVLRIFSGDFQRSEMARQARHNMWIIAALIMLVPILMVFFSLVLDQPLNRWANMIAAGLLLIFNLVGLPGYPSLYDRFLLVVSLGFNLLTIWYAWGWI